MGTEWLFSVQPPRQRTQRSLLLHASGSDSAVENFGDTDPNPNSRVDVRVLHVGFLLPELGGGVALLNAASAFVAAPAASQPALRGTPAAQAQAPMACESF